MSMILDNAMVLHKGHSKVVTEEEEVLNMEIGHMDEEHHLIQAVLNVMG